MLRYVLRKCPLGGIPVTICVLSAVGSIDALAQERSWEMVLYLGRPNAGPAEELEDAMRASEWDDSIPGDPGNEKPSSTDPEWFWAGSLRWNLRPRMTVELMATRATTGSTTGFRDDFPIDRFLFLTHSVTTMVPIASLRAGGWHVGGGPTINQVRLENNQAGDPGEGSEEAWKLGALADVGVTFPQRSRLFLDARAQYRWIPGLTAGPFTAQEGTPEQGPATMPAVDVDMSHAFFALGLGARF